MIDYKRRSRNLRRHHTEAEKIIWRYVRNRQINGIKFHRQYVIEPYICDFVARDIDLIIEIDGGQHSENKYDDKRTSYLNHKGYKIIRYWNNDVMNNIEGVIEDMTKTIETLTPALSLKGEGVLPTPKLERWKYSNLPAYVSAEYENKPLTVHYEGDKSFVMDKPVMHTPWAKDDYEDMQLWEGLQDVFSVNIPADTHVDKPVNLSLNIAEGQKNSGNLHLTVQKNASVKVYETLNVEGWCIRTLTIELEEGASLTHIRTGEGKGVVTNLTQVRLAENARYSTYALNNYGAFVRDQIHAKLEGEKSECLLSGTKILRDQQHCDTTILIEHMAPNCHSNQNYRNLLDDRSRGVFQGKVHVHQIAQQTDGYQLCNSVLLSERAEMDTKPELEIYADDVRCSHGATTASPDDEPLFYLMARGIPEIQARNILLQAFVNESLEAFEEEEDIYAFLANKIETQLDAT